ncbi:Nramp family divalent metal transporter [uncultured Sphingomonas sp.]|uniref:Nramp family divalent metal transporter n=1 Tax=uncultured Sphingomonas sp. TaxID=158754 RepID=UPI002603478B|nr:Nramp family divalent metal transporter [uncultured Sphingomonas sp.]
MNALVALDIPVDIRRPAPQGASLSEVNRSIAVPQGKGAFWRKLAAFSGPGYLVAVGYMDPGNWATDVAGGSAYGYELLSVVLVANFMAMLLQALSARLGIVTGLDLAQACRQHYGRRTRVALWLLCEVAIVACDLAEVIGTAIALQLLFHIPMVIGVCLTAADVLIVLALQKHGFRKLETFIIALLGLIAGCFIVELILAQPLVAGIAGGFVPHADILTNPGTLYLAIGILGATVMPHNLYLHSSIVQTRRFERSPQGKAEAVKLATIDSTVALMLAFGINAAILILAASTFHKAGMTDVAEIQDAFRMLSPLMGAGAASVLFAVALLASGQNSTITGTLAGQIVMEGFVDLKMPAWSRRLITRLLAVIPAAVVAAIYGANGSARMLVLSQVVLSLQLPFAVVPLVRFTSDSAMMGRFASRGVLKWGAWAVAFAVIGLNLVLLGSLW